MSVQYKSYQNRINAYLKDLYDISIKHGLIIETFADYDVEKYNLSVGVADLKTKAIIGKEVNFISYGSCYTYNDIPVQVEEGDVENGVPFPEGED